MMMALMARREVDGAGEEDERRAMDGRFRATPSPPWGLSSARSSPVRRPPSRLLNTTETDARKHDGNTRRHSDSVMEQRQLVVQQDADTNTEDGRESARLL
ncbi:Alpha-actinin-like protein 1 [Cercospora beticola]|uniref:Alpha-actinin-like protein 1 n=1 Tax=Cercospora beticola TaxID=122368 RepID=A0A2G5HI62_CERBT|nr:Alpha-actinin-like protein 1 [Cercospora beticola]PIA91893.1 Alpha-actinin-like protein 1 [Cercospora beticola]CAK1366446.1 unnamed protein product [Cercospora beticola]